ncbi:MAG: LysR family transcriptional regulator [Rhizobium sp.]|nr:LysR family transcriptional regulator [Rhizobium sp.]
MRDATHEYEAIVRLARTSNFRAAAVELGMSPSALSHAVAAVEARLGIRLFNRTTRSVSLTEAGEQFVARVAPALADIRYAVEQVNSHRETPMGTLRINTSVGAARQFMPTVLDYISRYPEMKVDIVTENKLVDIVAGGFDAGIRLAEYLPQDMISVPLGDRQRMVVVASPGYFAANPPPKTPADLLSHRCIRMRMPGGNIWSWEFERHGEMVNIDVDGLLTLDEPNLILEAALAGVGIAFMNEWNVEDHVADGRLVLVMDEWTPPFPGLCLYYPGRRHVPAGLRAMIDLIKEKRAKG